MKNHKRKKPGPPPMYEKAMVRKNTTLPPSIVRHLEEVGGGNLSRGIRRLAEEDMKK